MIDENGYRANVGIVLADGRGRVFWGRRKRQDAWQFPQGGIQPGETPRQAMYRELGEEVGLPEGAVRVVATTRQWLRYRLPRRMVRHDADPVCIGQKQKWFLLEFLGEDSMINLEDHDKPEFDQWQWVSYWYPVLQVISFKQDVYRRALRELSRSHSMLVQKHREAGQADA